MREWQFLSRLGRIYDVRFVAVTRHFERDVSYAAALLEHCRSVTFLTAQHDAADAVGLPDRVRQHFCPAAAVTLRGMLTQQKIDLVHVEGYFLMHHLPVTPPVPILLVAENVEYKLERARHAVLGPSGPDWTVTRRLEQGAWRRATRCGAVSSDDAAVMEADVPGLAVEWLPTGCDHFSGRDPGAAPRVAGLRVVYTGSAAWGPSRDATFFLIRQVWPLVLSEVPDATLTIAGDGQDATRLGLIDVAPSVELLGTLPSLGPLLRTADVFVCGVRFGSGVKSKILESVHAACAVVSTSVGLQGLPSAVREAVLRGDTASDLAARIVDLLRDPELAVRVRARVHAAARALPTWRDAVQQLDRVWRETAALTTAPYR